MTDPPAPAPSDPPAAGTGAAQGTASRDDEVAWGISSGREHRWPASIAVVVAIALQIVLPYRVTEGLGPRWLLPALEGALLVALAELIRALLDHASPGGRSLVYASVPIWITNVIVFGLWYWELDRGGVAARLHPTHRRPDFLFPQMSTPGSAPGWTPDFLDYLYTSFTNATAFSPTDTMPLTAWSKLLMMLQSLASLLTDAIVISRAVNILN